MVRLAQFHEFLDHAFTGMSRLGALISDRNVVAQPVDTGDIAPELLRVLLEKPSVERVEFAGPERLGLDQALTEWTEATNRRRRILHLRIPGKLGRAFRSGALTTRNGGRGSRTWKDYLEAKYTPAASSRIHASGSENGDALLWDLDAGPWLISDRW